MNEQTTKLIEQLAQKLGTTAEYLWTVLVKQAPISAATDALYFILVIIGGIFLWKLHKYLSKERGEYKHSIYYDEEENVTIPMFIAVIIWAILFIVCFSSIGNIINGFFNPEYWALKEVLGACK
jgi:phosphotransferase system  glucose/maltose/N-acetylglucosamine-specific IIC component